MPKASRVGKFRQTAKAAASSNASPAAPSAITDAVCVEGQEREDNNNLSRGQKKRMAKREQYLRKERLVMNSLLLKKQEEQAKRIDGLDAIKQALLATTTAETSDNDEAKKGATNLLKSQKSRQNLLQREANQLKLVMQHPSFQADPLATIREHLTNSLADQAAQREREQEQHEREVREAAKETPPKKRKRKKHRARPTRSKA